MSLLSAWQASLAAEQEAAFAYGLLGPKLSGTQQQLAITCSNQHDALRDRTASSLAAAGAVPVAPEADYPALYPVLSASDARKLAVRVEESCAAAWRYLYAVAASTADPSAAVRRAEAQMALSASAVRATRWRLLTDPSHATVPFPGI